MKKRLIRTLSLGIVVALSPSLAICLTADERRISVTVPAAPWTLTIPADDFVIKQQQQKPDGSAGYFYMIDDKKHLDVSMFIEPVKDCRESKGCRDMVWKLGNPNWVDPQNVVMSEIGDVSTFEFLIPSFRGQPIKQQNMYAEFVVDGFWVDLHISKVLYKAEEHAMFERLVKSVRFEPKKSATSETRN